MSLPFLTGLANAAAFAENAVNASPQRLDTDVTFAWGSVVGGTLAVSGLLAEDRVSIESQGSGTGQIGFDGMQVTYGGIQIGSAIGGIGTNFVVTLNTSATAPGVEALIERLTFANVSDTPTATRDLTLNLVDANGVRASAGQVLAFTASTGSANPFNGLGFGFAAAPSFVDWDGDGDFDLVGGRFSGDLEAWRNTGTANAPIFTQALGPANPFNLIGYSRSGPSFVDWDGDGDFDLVLGFGQGSLPAWRNTGSATAPVFTAVTGGADPFDGIDVGFLSRPSFVDWDGDGDFDLVSGEWDGTLLAWRNTGSATAPVFTAVTGGANPFDGIDVGDDSAPNFVDWDGDGDFDLVLGETKGTLLAWRNTGSTTAPIFTAVTGSANPFNGIDVGGYSTPSFVDLDGDGDRDLVSGASDGKLLVWRNTPAPGPSPTITVTVTAQNDAPVVTSSAAASSAENATGVAYHAAGADPEGTTLTWSLGGIDAALFNITSAGAVSFKTAPNFEAPADTGANNIYNLTVTASDGALSSAARAVAITVTNVVEAGSTVGGPGNDTLQGTDGADTLEGMEGADSLDGGSGNDRLLGGDGADTLNGGTGHDRMFGGLGDDVYVVDALGDIVNETGAGGYDLVRAGISFTLANGFEALLLTGTALNGTGSDGGNALTGNALANLLSGLGGADALFGEAGADTLLGGVGADTLDGGSGADSLVGGANDDVYVIRDLLETVVEIAGGGNDEVRATVSVTLAAEVERLKLLGSAGLSGTGNAGANRMDGNSGANLFVGLDGNDTLNGAGGADTLQGGEGNDILNGQAGADLLFGGAGNDRLSAGGGGDTLIGGTGADRLSGFAGISDVFRWASVAEGQGDVVIGFEHLVDRLDFAVGGFGGLALGVLAGANFALNATGLAISAAGQPQFIYETDTGRLWWDADGAGGAASVAMMQFAGRPELTAADIVLIA